MKTTEKFSQIQLLVLDVDGVLTDGRTRQDEHGTWRRVFSIRDSIGIRALKKAGMHFAIVTEASSPDIREHAAFLGIECVFEDCDDKEVVLHQLMRQLDLRPEQVLFMSDAVRDIATFRKVGCAVTVSSAHPNVREAASYVTAHPGGDAAVLEICNLIMKYNAKFKSTVKARTPGIGRRAAL